jgi:hypothetical protein
LPGLWGTDGVSRSAGPHDHGTGQSSGPSAAQLCRVPRLWSGAFSP